MYVYYAPGFGPRCYTLPGYVPIKQLMVWHKRKHLPSACVWMVPGTVDPED